MSFLAPLWLGLTALVAVPLLVHFLRRRIGRRVEFPAVRYLARAEREHSRSLRLRNIALLALRVLAVAAAAVAAARPLAAIAGGEHPPTAIAIVIDNSLSSGAIVEGRRTLDVLRAAALRAIEELRPADHASVITADGRVTVGGSSLLRAALQAIEPLAGRGDLVGAIGRARSFLSGNPARARVVALVTDGQRSTWAAGGESVARAAPSAGSTPIVVFRSPGDPPFNHAFTRIDVSPPRWTPRGTLSLEGTGIVDSAAYRVTLGDRTLARGTFIATRPGAPVTATLRATPPERGWLRGSAELSPDELRADDIRHFALWIGEPPHVQVMDDPDSFLRSAVEVLAGTGQMVLAEDGVSISSAERLTRLPALVLAPEGPASLGVANRALARAGVPWRFGSSREGRWSVGDGALGGTRVTTRYVLEPSARAGAEPAETLASAGGSPWVVAGSRYVLVGSPLVVGATDLPTRAAFVPWVGAMVARLSAGPAVGVVHAYPGAPIPRLLASDPPEALLAADGSTTSLERSRGSETAAPGAAGAYFFLRRGERVGALVVNPEPEESRLARLAPRELARRLGVDARVETDASAWTRLVFTTADGRSLTAPLLVIALLALAAEAAVSRRYGRSAA